MGPHLAASPEAACWWSAATRRVGRVSAALPGGSGCCPYASRSVNAAFFRSQPTSKAKDGPATRSRSSFAPQRAARRLATARTAGRLAGRARLTTPSHGARCARELSGGARRTRNRWWCSTRPCVGHRVEFLGFADVPGALGSRPAATLSPPRSRSKTSDASGRQGECWPLWPPNLGFLCDSRRDARLFIQPLLTPRDSHPFETQSMFSRRTVEVAEDGRKRAGWILLSLPCSAGSA